MNVIIDRFEGDYAVVEMENKMTATISKCLIPNVYEGDILKIEIDKIGTKITENINSNKIEKEYIGDLKNFERFLSPDQKKKMHKFLDGLK